MKGAAPKPSIPADKVVFHGVQVGNSVTAVHGLQMVEAHCGSGRLWRREKMARILHVTIEFETSA